MNMDTHALIKSWFDIWESGDFHSLPLTEDFRHTSPYGTIEGKKQYQELVEANKDKFLGNRFILHDTITQGDKACVRYTMVSPAFSMEVSEWFYSENGLIREIVSYYNIEGDISENRKLKDPK